MNKPEEKRLVVSDDEQVSNEVDNFKSIVLRVINRVSMMPVQEWKAYFVNYNEGVNSLYDLLISRVDNKTRKEIYKLITERSASFKKLRKGQSVSDKSDFEFSRKIFRMLIAWIHKTNFFGGKEQGYGEETD